MEMIISMWAQIVVYVWEERPNVVGKKKRGTNVVDDYIKCMCNLRCYLERNKSTK